MAKETKQKDARVGGASIFQLFAFTLLGALCATVWRLPVPQIRPFAGVDEATTISNEIIHYGLSHTSSNTLGLSKVKILSFDPFIVHITDFVTPAEREHLLNLGTPLLAKSYIIDNAGNQIPSPGRTSSTAFLPATDPVVAAIAARAAHFQGYLSPDDVDVQITAYQPGQQYKHHYDWYPDGSRAKNRLSTFFAILKSTCDNCGTEFPFINTSSRGQWDERWCGVIECEAEHLTTRNVEGSAVFWVNLDSTGKGRLDTLHAGLPALGGEKIGLNVWSDVDVGEAKGRGLLSGRNKHFWEPSKEFLMRYELVPPDEEGF